MPKLNISKSIDINAPADKIFNSLNNFDTWQIWSPWLIMEPDATVDIAADSKSYSWDGKRVGSGNMKVIGEDSGRSIDYDLNFIKPWKSNAKVRFETKANGDSTNVTWTMDSSLPFFMFFMKKMMEAFVGMDYDRGLAMLKEYMEDGEVTSKLDFKGTSDFTGGSYVGIKTSTTIDEIGSAMAADFGKLKEFVLSNEDIVSGPPFSIYHKWDMVNRKVSYTSGIPVGAIPGSLPDGTISGSIPPTKIYTIRHTGPYNYLGNAWSTLYNMERSKEFKMNKGIDPFEIYMNNPEDTDQKDLVTEINFPVK